MPTITLSFNNDINVSLQVGDVVYYCPTQPRGGELWVDNSELPSTGIVELGVCRTINSLGGTITVFADPNIPQINNIVDGIMSGDFIMFSKNTTPTTGTPGNVNLSSLLGYYAEAKFTNNSPSEAELFSVGAEISESSK